MLIHYYLYEVSSCHEVAAVGSLLCGFVCSSAATCIRGFLSMNEQLVPCGVSLVCEYKNSLIFVLATTV